MRYAAVLPAARRARGAGRRIPPTASGDEPEPVTIDAAYKKVRKAAKKPPRQATMTRRARNEKDEALHKIRKRAKRLRYTAAATGADKVSEKAKEIQSLLGDHQDSVVSRDHLIHQVQAAHAAGEDTFTYGLLFQQESDLADRSRAQLDSALGQLNKAVRKAR